MESPPKQLTDTVSIVGPAEPAGLAGFAPLPRAIAKGRYRTMRLLGEGGQKTAYLGRDIALDREVVISVLKTADLDETGLERLRREAKTMAQLGAHPNIVTVFDFAEEEGVPYVITEFVE